MTKTRTPIGTYPTARKAHDAGLAVLAAGRPYWVYPTEHGEAHPEPAARFTLWVPTADADWLRQEVSFLGQRNADWPPGPLKLPLKPAQLGPSLGVAALLIALFIAQGQIPGLTERGLVSSEAIREHGELWRVITAVTLHGDLAHLVGNLATLPVLGFFCSRYLGAGVAWLALLLLAALANLTNALLGEAYDFRSLGASTAGFAALGLLAGVPAGWYLRLRKPLSPQEWIVPLIGGIALFIWLGGGGSPDGRTDIAGHLWAFLYGILAAIPLAAGFLGPHNHPRLQRSAWLLTTALLTVAFSTQALLG